MAENNLEITYIPYGLDEISQLDLMTNLANGVEGYLGSRRWARKDKYRNAWLAAYLDIISHGLTGASNDSGIWTINHGQEAIPLDSKSNLEKEMYQDAAYYIQLQMAKMTPRKKEEEKKKENLTPFNFKESFLKLLLNNKYGGDPTLFENSETGWNTLDARGENGLRGTTKRREAMVSELESYLKTIEDGRFNFEGTSFKDENDARTKIQTAINALRNTPEDESDDIPAFNALGLNYRGFFSNGGNDIYGTVGDKEVTYQLYYDALRLEEEAKTKAEKESALAKLKALRERAQLYRNSISPFNNRQYLLLTPELIEEQKRQEAANRKLDKGWETEDYLRMGAMALDITGAVAAWAPGYGTAISGGLGLTSLGTNMAADIADESLTKWDVLKNAGVNLGLAAVGLVPGLGLASKSGKWLTNIAKWAPRLLTLQAIKNLPESYNSLQKAINNPKELTNADWKNIAYGLSIAAGLSRGAKGIVNNRKFKPTVTQETQTETYITTKSGKQIKATKEQVEAINKAGRKGGNDKANEELRKLPGALNEEVNINFKTGIKGKVDLANRVKLESSIKNIGQSPAVERYSRALSIKNIRDKAKHPLLSKYFPTDYDIYLGAAKVSIPNINVVDRFKQTWNPVSNRPFKGTKQNNNLQNSSNSSNSGTKTNTGSNAKPKQPILSKKDSNELLSTLRGKNFSTNEFKDESRVIGSVKGLGDLYGLRNSDGTHTLLIDFGGTRVNVTGTKADIKGKTLEVLRKDVMKKIDSLVPKEQRSKIKFDLIRQLKLNGYLRWGGQINSLDTVIEDFFKNNNI